MRIYYNKLNKEVKKKIKEKRYSRTELKEVYDGLKKCKSSGAEHSERLWL